MKFLKALGSLLPESDQTYATRQLQSIGRMYMEQYADFEAKAVAAGFTPEQAKFMNQYLSMSQHCHQYHGDMHDYPTTIPITNDQFRSR